jgi:hypothetical protein
VLAAVFVNDRFDCLLGASQANPERKILVFSGTQLQKRQPPLENIYVTVIGQQSPYRPVFIVQDGLVQRKYDPRPPRFVVELRKAPVYGLCLEPRRSEGGGCLIRPVGKAILSSEI